LQSLRHGEVRVFHAEVEVEVRRDLPAVVGIGVKVVVVSGEVLGAEIADAENIGVLIEQEALQRAVAV
jgi:hypothetical protein